MLWGGPKWPDDPSRMPATIDCNRPFPKPPGVSGLSTVGRGEPLRPDEAAATLQHPMRRALGGATLDASFGAVRRHTGHVVSILGWGTHSLAPLSFRGATYSGVFTLLPLLTGVGRAHHGEILRAAAALAEAGKLRPILHPNGYDLATVMDAHALVESGSASGKVVVTVTG